MWQARDDILRETKKQVMKESKMLERTKLALMREIHAGAQEVRLMDEPKMKKVEKNNRINKLVQDIAGAEEDDRCNRCRAEDRRPRDPRITDDKNCARG